MTDWGDHVKEAEQHLKKICNLPIYGKIPWESMRQLMLDLFTAAIQELEQAKQLLEAETA